MGKMKLMCRHILYLDLMRAGAKALGDLAPDSDSDPVVKAGQAFTTIQVRATSASPI